MVNLYDSYQQANIINYIPDSSQALLKAAEKKIEEYDAYQDKAEEVKSQVADLDGVTIYSTPDRENWESMMGGYKDRISNVFSSPGLNPRQQHRELMKITSEIKSNRALNDIIKTAKTTEEYMKGVQDPRTKDVSEHMWTKYDTIEEGRPIMFPSMKEPVWANLVKEAITNIPEQSMDEDGSINPKGSYYGRSEGMIDRFFEGSVPVGQYTSEGYFHLYEKEAEMAGFSGQEAKDFAYSNFIRDYKERIPSFMSLSKLGEAREMEKIKKDRQNQASDDFTPPKTVTTDPIYSDLGNLLGQFMTQRISQSGVKYVRNTGDQRHDVSDDIITAHGKGDVMAIFGYASFLGRNRDRSGFTKSIPGQILPSSVAKVVSDNITVDGYSGDFEVKKVASAQSSGAFAVTISDMSVGGGMVPGVKIMNSDSFLNDQIRSMVSRGQAELINENSAVITYNPETNKTSVVYDQVDWGEGSSSYKYFESLANSSLGATGIEVSRDKISERIQSGGVFSTEELSAAISKGSMTASKNLSLYAYMKEFYPGQTNLHSKALKVDPKGKIFINIKITLHKKSKVKSSKVSNLDKASVKTSVITPLAVDYMTPSRPGIESYSVNVAPRGGDKSIQNMGYYEQ